jgi:hypothetical protein
MTAASKAEVKKAASSVNGEGVKHYSERLAGCQTDNTAFDAAIAKLSTDRTINHESMHEIATTFLGYRPNKGTRPKLLRQIIDRQALDARQTARGNAILRGGTQKHGRCEMDGELQKLTPDEREGVDLMIKAAQASGTDNHDVHSSRLQDGTDVYAYHNLSNSINWGVNNPFGQKVGSVPLDYGREQPETQERKRGR